MLKVSKYESNVNSELLCAGKTDLFFSEKTSDMRKAQTICASCDFQPTCLSQARENPPFAGVWGGVIFVSGEELLVKRGRGRPRKSEDLDNARMIKILNQTLKKEEKIVNSDHESKLQIA